jgi:NAD(P)-dependent dehydrogenase (short-subunit alcohol dehydrogenase family)
VSRRFDGRGVVVTGAARGIGRAIVAAFQAEGARVVAVDVLPAVAEVPGVEALVVDLSRPGAAGAMVAEAAGLLGRIDVLVNNAAVMPDGPLLDVTEAEWDRTFAVNVRAVFFASQAAARHMVERGGGAIVNLSSANAVRSESPEAPYNASKAAVIAITRSLAHELGHHGVRANCVAPGETLTPEEAAEMSPGDRAAEREYVRRIPLRRVGRAAEQAAAVLFLASDDASFISGETLVVDGGELAGDWYDRSQAPPLPDHIEGLDESGSDPERTA